MNNLYKIWSRLGVGFGESFSHRGFVDLEQTILETCEAGRKDSRLLFGMRAWLLKHHDLVNRSVLIRLVKQQEFTAVLGAVIDSVLECCPRSGLQYVKKYCQPAAKREFVFERVAASSTLSKLTRKENLKVWKRWNLMASEMDEMRGAIAEKAFVLKHNQNLALRALFGPGIRAEVFSYFLQHGEGNAYQIAQQIGLSYEPVYSELQLCQRTGLMVAQKAGKALVYQLKPYFMKQALRAWVG